MKMKTVDLKVDEDHKVIILLCLLLERYTKFVNNLIYDRETLTLNDVKTHLLSKELHNQMREFGISRGASRNGVLFVERE